ncbi:helix-turn-helix domain-containing protein [Halosegnis marinus]|uniref:HTH domain-containing protein n=1 Tax=Halosegnis marinus TaxID=3034023 RepID=A0ABD5ZTR9_9EURY|nr:helix-turn-helix domain-containing protein [Halosegnis sp. DT85]
MIREGGLKRYDSVLLLVPRGPAPKHSDEEILRLFRETADPVLFASEIAESLDTTRQTVYSRMEDLHSEGLVHTKKPGQRSRVYWISYEGEQFLDEQESPSGSQ